jgi:A/G-specific adenine glycosylase
VKNFSRELIRWYEVNKRDLPWRQTTNPYFIWLSEVILQQTRVEQGRSYYLKFVKRFPTVSALASAGEEEVLKLWQGLGYYSRGRNLLAAAQQIVNAKPTVKDYFPSTYQELIQLKGVGEYTAAAISSIAFGEPKAVVDGNVYRVLSRVFGIASAIDSTSGKKEFQLLAQNLLDKNRPGDHNQALMELGALVCKPKNPSCNACPCQRFCSAAKAGNPADFPLKEKKIKVRTRYFYYFIFNYDGKILLRKRVNSNDIWMGLHDFPLIESEKEVKVEDVLKKAVREFTLSKTDFAVKKISVTHKHVLSHQVLYATFFHLQLKKTFNKNLKNYIVTEENRISEFAIPRLIDRYLQRSV